MEKLYMEFLYHFKSSFKYDKLNFHFIYTLSNTNPNTNPNPILNPNRVKNTKKKINYIITWILTF